MSSFVKAINWPLGQTKYKNEWVYQSTRQRGRNLQSTNWEVVYQMFADQSGSNTADPT